MQANADAVEAARQRAARRSRLVGRLSKRGLTALTYALLIVASASFSLPFVWMISSSLKAQAQVFIFPPRWIPRPAYWSNYLELMRVWQFGLYTRNSLTIALPSIVGSVLSTSMAAYAFSRLRGFGRETLFAMVLATMMLPYPVTMIPLFLLFKKLDWTNTYLPLVVPSFFGYGAFYIFLLRQFFMGIPQELSDAAKIDGCSHIGIYWRIIMPLAKPALATVAIFDFMGNWNDLLGPLIYINSMNKYTLALGLAGLRSVRASMTPWHLLMAGSIVVALPPMILFFTAQRLFIQGIVVTGVKG